MAQREYPDGLVRIWVEDGPPSDGVTSISGMGYEQRGHVPLRLSRPDLRMDLHSLLRGPLTARQKLGTILLSITC